MKTVGDRVFELLKERGMTQKELSIRTGIAESTISDWKKKKNNPVSDKVLILCEVLDVDPYDLLSGAEGRGGRSRSNDTYVVDKKTDLGQLIEMYQAMDVKDQSHIIGYMKAMNDLQKR